MSDHVEAIDRGPPAADRRGRSHVDVPSERMPVASIPAGSRSIDGVCRTSRRSRTFRPPLSCQTSWDGRTNQGGRS
jgi:hypothetical protein